MSVEEGFHSHPSFNPWVAAFDGWVELKNVLWFLEKGGISLPGPAAKVLRPALERGTIRNRVVVRSGRWDAMPREIKSTALGGTSYTIMEEVFIIDPAGVHTTSTVEKEGGWPFVDWLHYSIRGHVIQVDWRAVLRAFRGSKPTPAVEISPVHAPPAPEEAPRIGRIPTGRPSTPFWLAFRKEVVRRIYENTATTRRQMRDQMDAWAKEACAIHGVEVPSDDMQRQAVRELLPDEFPTG